MLKDVKVGDIVHATGRWDACYDQPSWEATIRLTVADLREANHISAPGWPRYLRGVVETSESRPSIGQVAQGDATGYAPPSGTEMEWIESYTCIAGVGYWRRIKEQPSE